MGEIKEHKKREKEYNRKEERKNKKNKKWLTDLIHTYF